MYGTVARLKVKPGQVEALKDWSAAQSGPNPSVVLVFQMDHDPHELYLVVAAESRDAYRAEAESPASHQRYLEMMAFLAAEPEWHDGTVLDAQLP